MDPNELEAKKKALMDMRSFARQGMAGDMKKRKSQYQTGLDAKGAVEEYGSSDDAMVMEMGADKKRMDAAPKQAPSLSDQEAEEMRERLRQYDHFKQVTADEE